MTIIPDLFSGRYIYINPELTEKVATVLEIIRRTYLQKSFPVDFSPIKIAIFEGNLSPEELSALADQLETYGCYDEALYYVEQMKGPTPDRVMDPYHFNRLISHIEQNNAVNYKNYFNVFWLRTNERFEILKLLNTHYNEEASRCFLEGRTFSMHVYKEAIDSHFNILLIRDLLNAPKLDSDTKFLLIDYAKQDEYYRLYANSFSYSDRYIPRELLAN
ncbi:MAG: hypothetical protein ACOYK9_04665 [Chlamydiia bacterium]